MMRWIRRLRQSLGVTPIFALFILALLGLPVAVTVAVRTQMELESLDNARAISRLILEFRRYYNLEIVARVQKAQGPVVVTENYHDIAGAIPIPATMSIELAELLSRKLKESPFSFAFLSDRPFSNRQRPALDGFQRAALEGFRGDSSLKEYWEAVEQPGIGRSLRLAIPVRMEAPCVACHNAHPQSTFRQWKVGDVRGIQDITIAPRVTEAHQRNLAFLAASGPAGSCICCCVRAGRPWSSKAANCWSISRSCGLRAASSPAAATPDRQSSASASKAGSPGLNNPRSVPSLTRCKAWAKISTTAGLSVLAARPAARLKQ